MIRLAFYAVGALLLAASVSGQNICISSASPAKCDSHRAGFILIPPGQTFNLVTTTAVKETDEVFILGDISLGTKLGVTCNTQPLAPITGTRVLDGGFVAFVAEAPVTSPLCLSYMIRPRNRQVRNSTHPIREKAHPIRQRPPKPRMPLGDSANHITLGGDDAKLTWVNNSEKGRYLLVYRERVLRLADCSQTIICLPDKSKIHWSESVEQEVYKYFPTLEEALTFMNQGSEPRVSKKMFQSLSYVIDLSLDLESETVRVNREVSKWRVKQ